ncbi:MAG: hypothetical protein RI988_1895 [Pseudomonadota bacterium]
MRDVPSPRHRVGHRPAAAWRAGLAITLAVGLGQAGSGAGAAPPAWPPGSLPDAAWAAAPPHPGEPPDPPPGLSTRAQPVAPAAPGRAGRLTDFEGPVWFFDTAQGRWEEGLRNRALTGGDRLSTGAQGRAEVRIGSTELRLGPRTEVEFVEFTEGSLVWRLATGSLAWRVRRHEIARETEVRAAGVRVHAEGPGHYRLDVDDGVASASAWRGRLRVDTGDQSVRVGEGQRAEFMRPGPGPGTAVTWSSTTRDAFADWVARDEWRDVPQDSASATYVSPEMTGIEDLDRHGSWERHPEFGMVWTPRVVAAGWEPFRHGRWVWHARWGWTWVDAAPWGFAPFHYGRWLMWGGRWCWVPGPYQARPAFSPALVAWVGSPGPHVGVGVTLHGRHWVPLPPRHAHPPPRAYTPEPPRRPPEPHGRGRPHVDDRPQAEHPPRSVHPVQPAQPGVPARDGRPAPPAESVDRLRRIEPGNRSPRTGGADDGPGRPPSDRSRREDAADTPAQEPMRARVPEAMRDRPRERQQMQ